MSGPELARSAAARRLHRRPSGEPPPLPRELGRSGRVLLAFSVLIVVVGVFIVIRGADTTLERLESPFMVWLADLRTSGLTSLMELVDRLGQAEVVWILRLAILLGLVAFKRWRHLFTYVGLLIVVDGVSANLIGAIGRPRPMASRSSATGAGTRSPRSRS